MSQVRPLQVSDGDWVETLHRDIFGYGISLKDFLGEHHIALGIEGKAYLLLQWIPPEAEILYLAVEASFRRQGMARAMMETFVGQYGPESIFLEVRETNEEALSFYRKEGFCAMGRRVDYYGVGLDAITMERRYD
ncbi:MAG: GNAT family N-acetyltransferase [Tissierellia bacterium]|nr:GNAT family N-acetyltransferase [Tissierellia bacterium]